MVNRIEVGFRKGVRDALGEKVRRRIIENLHMDVEDVRTVDVYTIEGDLRKRELTAAARGPLSDPIIQRHAVNRGLADGFDWLIEVGFRPGVTDNVGKTARESIELVLGDRRDGRSIGVYTSRQYIIRGGIGREEAERIASGLLANDLIERYDIISGKDWNPAKGMPAHVPRVMGEDDIRVEEIDLQVSGRELLEISNRRVLALSLAEMKAIRDYFRSEAVLRERRAFDLGERITDVELESLAQTWSEHCKHKIFNSRITYAEGEGKSIIIDSLFDTFIKGSTKEIREKMGGEDWCLSVFVDNAGVIKFNEDYNLVFKV